MATNLMATIEAHMHDHVVVALDGLVQQLLIQHYETADSPFLRAADGDTDLAHDMVIGACMLHVAARKTIRARSGEAQA